MSVYLKWLLLFLPQLLLSLLARPLALIYCLPRRIERSLKADVVKRLGKQVVALERDNLHPSWWGFSTPDNNADEWWYGMYNTKSFKFAQEWTQEDYDNSSLIRYFCRVMWFMRNGAYGYSNKWFGMPKESLEKVYEINTEDSRKMWLRVETYPSYFRIETQFPIPFTDRYFSQDFGWQDHRGQSRVTFAGRIVSLFRKYKK